MNWFVFAVFLVFSGFIAFIGYFMTRRYHRLVASATATAEGEVIGYSFPGDGRVHPKLEFEVDGQRYTSKLKYAYVVKKRGTFIRGTTLKSDPLDRVFRVHANSMLMTNPLLDIFPVGTLLTVYYNPENPKQNYTERPTGNVTGKVFLYTALGILIFGGVISYFIPV